MNIFLETYHRLHAYNIETGELKIYTGANVRQYVNFRGTDNILAPIIQEATNKIRIFGIPCKLCVRYYHGEMLINPSTSSYFISFLFKDKTGNITAWQLIEKLKSILACSHKYFTCTDSKTATNGQTQYDLENQNDRIHILEYMTSRFMSNRTITNQFCRSAYDEQFIYGLHFRNFVTWFHETDVFNLEVKQTKFGLYYIRSASFGDPFFNMPNKYAVVSSIVGYPVKRGVSPELKTKEDALKVIEYLQSI